MSVVTITDTTGQNRMQCDQCGTNTGKVKRLTFDHLPNSVFLCPTCAEDLRHQLAAKAIFPGEESPTP